MTTTVNDIEHIERQSYPGVAVIQVYFHPDSNVETGHRRKLPPSTRPFCGSPAWDFPRLRILKYNASSVPILQLGLSSQSLSEGISTISGQNFIRTQLATVQGASTLRPKLLWTVSSAEV